MNIYKLADWLVLNNINFSFQSSDMMVSEPCISTMGFKIFAYDYEFAIRYINNKIEGFNYDSLTDFLKKVA